MMLKTTPNYLKNSINIWEDTHLYAHYAVYDFNVPDLVLSKIKPRYVEDTIYTSRHAYPELMSHSLASVLNHIGLESKGEEGSSDWGVEELTKEQILLRCI